MWKIDFLKFPNWPIVDGFDGKIEEYDFIERKEAKYKNYTQIKYIPLVDADKDVFPDWWLEIINWVLDNYGHKNAKWLSHFSHWDAPYIETENWAVIDRELVMNRSPIYSNS